MTVVSGAFLLFLLIAIGIYYACPVQYRWQVLLAASLVFYVLAGKWRFLPCVLLTAFVVWSGALRLSNLDDELKTKLKEPGVDKQRKKDLRATYKSLRKRTLIGVLVLCIGALCVTKFSGVVISALEGIASIYSQGVHVDPTILLMPLGISYYTFSTLGYLLDVYWHRYPCEQSYPRFLLYTIYFPHILQGPISRYNRLGASLKLDAHFDERNLVHGGERIIWGFFKKLVIADRLNLMVTTVYNGEPHAGSIVLVVMVLDALMIYMDFSGYMEIVCGASQMLGVELEENFNHPFFSRSVAEFWRRWHMTLGGWFKDYVYYPVSVSSWMKKLNRKNAQRFSKRVTRVISVAIPCLITWMLTGLWHGTGPNYVCWGIYYGVLITISVAFQEEFEQLDEYLGINVESRSWKLFQMLRTFCIFVGGRVLTSPGNLANTAMVFRNIFFNLQPWQWFDDSIWTYGLTRDDGHILFISLLVVLVVSIMQERMSVRDEIDRRGTLFKWALIYIGIIVVIVFGVYGPGYDAAKFIYMQY
ncbi:MAG: MBOAT family O-acyltransferase [Atopobiaceae bacterium]|nr:MBOAT family O-acyltransferase [Atopobiaceae bacterium]